MKIVVFTQDNCAWCTRLHPHILRLANDLDMELEYINITDRWELAEEYQFRTTPTVFIFDSGVALKKFSIKPGEGIAEMINNIKKFTS